MMGLSDLAVMCALAAGAVGVGGGVYHGTVWPALVGCSFTAVFWSTLRLHEKRRTTMMTQALLVLLLVMLSFALHLIFLPAGICCFFAMICVKNELRAAPSRNRAARPRPFLLETLHFRSQAPASATAGPGEGCMILSTCFEGGNL